MCNAMTGVVRHDDDDDDDDCVDTEEEEKEEEEERTIRAKWSMDGARTLAEAARMLVRFAEHLERLGAEGWELRDPIDDDWGFAYRAVAAAAPAPAPAPPTIDVPPPNA